jgi:uncharacterized protein (DUF1800 family)
MGNKDQSRRAFFRKLVNRDENGTNLEALAAQAGIFAPAPAGEDKLFDKYSRKTLSGGRSYTDRMAEESTPEAANRVGTVSSGLTAYTGTWSEWEAAHLLRRTCFSATNADVSYLLTMTMANAVDDVLNVSSTTPSAPSAAPLNYYNNTAADSSSVALGATWTGTNLSYTGTSNNDSTVDAYRQYSLTAWHWGLWLNGGPKILEKMVKFWYHFIPVNFDDLRNQVSNGATLSAQYMTTLRNNALGDYMTLIQAIAKTPAMLVYLGGHYSTASTPNENFGRELLELFAMGKLPTQNYDEDDVKAAAKVFSGWRVSAAFNSAFPLSAGFNSSYHNTSKKTFSSNFGGTAITGLTGPSGATEFDSFFNMLFAQQGTTIAKYICRRLYRFFVYYDIDANVETNVIAGLASTLITNSWNIIPVLKQLFKSQHFYDMANRGVMIKSPIDLLTGTLRSFGVNTTAAAGATQVVNQYNIWKYFHDYCNNYLEQGFGLVPTVSGWKGYYQSPGYYQNWINTNTIQRRSTLLTSLMNGITVGGISMKIDPVAFVNQYPQATISDPDLLVAAIVKTLLPVDLPQAERDQLKIQNLLQNQTNNSYWTSAWAAYYGPPLNSMNLSTVKTRLSNLITAILQRAEYQLM